MTETDYNQIYTFVFKCERFGTSAARPPLNVDWSVMPDQPYLVYFNYVGELNNIDGTMIPSVYGDMLDGCSFQAVSATERTQSVLKTLLGLLRIDFIGSNSFVYADFKNNVPVYIPGRPKKNQCRFDITANALDPRASTYQPLLNDLAPYVLTMCFVPANSGYKL